MLVGEQPGDREDIEGHPFVGPAGGVLDKGLERAGIDPDDAYITNVVKHFRYKARGKRRIHSEARPLARQRLPAVAAGRDRGGQARPRWSASARPPDRRCSAPRSASGRDRGRPLDSDLAELVTLTTHPSAILRAEDAEREAAMDQFVADLTNVSTWLNER